MDDRFFHAFLPPTLTVAGRDLKRFTLWHHFLLSAIDSPIISGRSFNVHDLIAAVKCCRSSYGKKVDMTPSLRDCYWEFRYKKNPKLFQLHGVSFFEWMNIQCSPPRFWRTPGKGGSSVKIDNGPRCLAMACSLMHRAGFSREEAWDTPVGEALWIDAQIAKIEGVEINFLDDADLDDTPLSFDEMTEEQVMERFRRDLPSEEIAKKSFEHWKKNRKQ